MAQNQFACFIFIFPGIYYLKRIYWRMRSVLSFTIRIIFVACFLAELTVVKGTRVWLEVSHLQADFFIHTCYRITCIYKCLFIYIYTSVLSQPLLRHFTKYHGRRKLEKSFVERGDVISRTSIYPQLSSYLIPGQRKYFVKPGFR